MSLDNFKALDPLKVDTMLVTNYFNFYANNVTILFLH